MGHPDFRVGGKIFATLGPEGDWGMVKVGPDEQATTQMVEFANRTHQSEPHKFARDYTPADIQTAASDLQAIALHETRRAAASKPGNVWLAPLSACPKER